MISYDYQNTYLREYLERCKDIVTVPGNSKVLISQSKLVIVNYLSTAYLEALISDVPTVFFWNKESYFLDDKYSDFYDLLISVGICQTDPVKAANFIDIIADCAEDWWLSDSVRKARNSFLSVNFGEPQKMVDYLIELARL
jgi:putative transferase (TIGR04331 family)